MVVKTIVTTDMIDKIAEKNNVSCYNVLTGFKWIAELIREKEGKENYIVGGEESFGLMIGDNVRDKDAVSAVAIICEIAAVEKQKGRTLFEKLMDLYVEYGFYYEKLISITKKGMNGSKEIAAMMQGYRDNPPKEIAGSKVKELLDYQLQVKKNLITGESEKIDLPKSNVLQFITEDGSKISARPSGTEPKIKFYFSVNTPLANVSEFDATQEKLFKKIDTIISSMNLK
jgi:phosphoglucomutase